MRMCFISLHEIQAWVVPSHGPKPAHSKWERNECMPTMQKESYAVVGNSSGTAPQKKILERHYSLLLRFPR